ncbi:short-chain collagen C4-like [Amphiura filiformis]|uniref:short-chain collagen C4-like n=1 Tax=Amphiura filiformis TaxID=82378 RepID=UPI003B211632
MDKLAIVLSIIIANSALGSANDINLQCTSSAPSAAGVTYIRWGRTTCPETAELVYSGVAGGAKGASLDSAPNSGAGPDVPGGGSNYLCLPSKPQLRQSVSGIQDTRARIYAVNYRSGDPGALRKRHHHGAPCAFCQSREGRSQSFMMPATTQCPTGWTKEYDGILAAARWNHPRTEHVCLDRNLESTGKTESDDNRAPISYFFEIEVGKDSGFPSAYKPGDDLGCAICTM